MAECDRQLEQYLQSTEDRSQGAPLPEEKRKGRLKKKKGNKPQFDLREGLFRITGTDLTRIDGIDVMTALAVISEAGYDMSKWKVDQGAAVYELKHRELQVHQLKWKAAQLGYKVTLLPAA